MARIDELRAEYRRLINSMEFAYAMGHSRTLGKDPRLQPVLDRVAELRREVAGRNSVAPWARRRNLAAASRWLDRRLDL